MVIQKVNRCEPVQKIMKMIGDGGCYFLSLLNLAFDYDQKIIFQSTMRAYLMCLKESCISETCYVYNPIRVMELMGCTKYREVYKIPVAQFDGNSAGIIGQFDYLNLTHFVNLEYSDGKFNVVNDSLGESNCVRKGKLVSLRLFQ